jgi:hypothetical protein
VKDLARPIVVLAGLWALAVAQPILDVLRRAPEFFVAHRADALDAVVVAVALTVAVPITLAAMLFLVRALSRKLVDPVTAAVVGALAAIIAVQVAYRVGVSGWQATIVVAALVAALAAFAWLWLNAFRTFLVVLSPAALVVPLVFLVGGPWRSSGVGQAGQSGVAAARATPIVIMVFDELSLVSLLDDAGRLNAVRFPNLAALAADGVWFRNATAVSDYTRWALPSIVTGRYPSARSTPTPADHPNTVFSLVGRSHRLEVSEAVTSLCPRQLCSDTGPPRADREAAMAADIVVVAGHVFLPPSARASLPDLTQNWAGFAAADDDGDVASDDVPDDGAQTGTRVIRATRSWQRRWHSARGTDHVSSAELFIDGISADDRQPTLYFIHTLASHRPSRWVPSGQRIPSLREIPGLTNGKWTDVEWLVAQHHHADIMQAGLADTLVGRVRSRLSAAGLYDSSLVIVTADHGVALRSGDSARNFTGTNAAEILSVPLIVKPPVTTTGVTRGAIDDTNAETIDVLPTVARVLGIDPPWKVDGRSLIGADPPRADKRFFFNAATMHETYAPDQLRPSRDQAARRQADMFGLDEWPVFTVPGLRSLAGRDVGSFGEIRRIDSVSLAVDGRDAFKHVNPNGRDLPAQLVGRFVRTDVREAARHVLAVALNGTIVATTRAWPGTLRWMAMLPPDALRAGENDVDVFVVDPSSQDRLLRPRQ